MPANAASSGVSVAGHRITFDKDALNEEDGGSHGLEERPDLGYATNTSVFPAVPDHPRAKLRIGNRPSLRGWHYRCREFEVLLQHGSKPKTGLMEKAYTAAQLREKGIVPHLSPAAFFPYDFHAVLRSMGHTVESSSENELPVWRGRVRALSTGQPDAVEDDSEEDEDVQVLPATAMASTGTLNGDSGEDEDEEDDEVGGNHAASSRSSRVERGRKHRRNLLVEDDDEDRTAGRDDEDDDEQDTDSEDEEEAEMDDDAGKSTGRLGVDREKVRKRKAGIAKQDKRLRLGIKPQRSDSTASDDEDYTAMYEDREDGEDDMDDDSEEEEGTLD